jgi:hypothetical protein
VDSLVLRNVGGRLSVAQRFEGLGLVSGAVWSDVTGDHRPELILACEWGPVRVFQNVEGRFEEITGKLGLERYVGWWNGVTSGDFNGDGRLDLAVGNWGLNTKYRPNPEHPWKAYYGNLGGSGGVDVVEAHDEPAIGAEVPERGLRAISAAMPWVRDQVGTYEAYGQARLVDIFGDRLKGTGVVSVNTLASAVFINRGDHFEMTPLPPEAQWAPAFGVNAGDLDGDGLEDLFLSQNFFPVNGEMSRCDAGRGLWLRGDGKGGFHAVPGQESGIEVYGDQRGSALGDYDGDGRGDLVVTQNGGETKLYRNARGRPGLRVRLKGPTENPRGIGTVIRPMFGPRQGPAREIHGGSGYWSQDSAVPVLGSPEPVTQVYVRWPGGETITVPVPAGAREIEIDGAGKVRSIR